MVSKKLEKLRVNDGMQIVAGFTFNNIFSRKSYIELIFNLIDLSFQVHIKLVVETYMYRKFNGHIDDVRSQANYLQQEEETFVILNSSIKISEKDMTGKARHYHSRINLGFNFIIVLLMLGNIFWLSVLVVNIQTLLLSHSSSSSIPISTCMQTQHNLVLNIILLIF